MGWGLVVCNHEYVRGPEDWARPCSLAICHQVFTLPKVSAKTKFKLTAHEGCRVRKVALATFASVACEDYAETCLACLTNLGDVHVFSVPGLRPQVHYSCIRKEDISGIASCVFTRHGQGEPEWPGRKGI